MCKHVQFWGSEVYLDQCPGSDRGGIITSLVKSKSRRNRITES